MINILGQFFCLSLETVIWSLSLAPFKKRLWMYNCRLETECCWMKSSFIYKLQSIRPFSRAFTHTSCWNSIIISNIRSKIHSEGVFTISGASEWANVCVRYTRTLLRSSSIQMSNGLLTEEARCYAAGSTFQSCCYQSKFTSVLALFATVTFEQQRNKHSARSLCRVCYVP